MAKAEIGVVGLAVMGKNLALNLESRGFTVAVYNRSRGRTDEMIAEHPGKRLVPAYTPEEFVASLERPRKILLMVMAGAPTDETIQQLLPHLEEGDILIDGGNAFFEDTRRRGRELAARGIRFIGAGISGGEEGALRGPAIMPGGPKDAYEAVAPLLEAIAAKVGDDPCCAYIGPDGAGHYVKMVHNGIEYGDMQLICEAYHLLREIAGADAAELHRIFAEWNRGELDSYLIQITADIFTKKDPDTGRPMVDVILDKAGQKGTGKWTSQSALDLGVPLTMITEAVFARFLSAMKDERLAAVARAEAEASRRRSRRFRRSCPPRAVREQDLFVRSGVRAAARGVGALRMESRLRFDRDDFPRRLHHPRALSAEHQGRVRPRC